MTLTRSEKLVSLGTPPQAAKEIVRQINAQIGNRVYLTALGISAPLAKEIAAQITSGDMPPLDAIDRLVSMGVVPMVAELIVEYIAGGSGPAPELPSTISDLAAVGISATQVQLSFTPSVNATSHHYRRALAGTGNWTAPAVLIGDTISGLVADTNYDFQVRGVNVVGAGAWSNIATAQTEAAPTVPGSISDLVATAIDDQSVSLAFTPAVDATSHEFRYGLAGSGIWTTPATLIGNTVSGLAENTNYDFQVRGVNSVGAGAWSNTATAQTADLSAPTLSSPFVMAGDTTADLSVTTNEGNGTLYWVVTQSATPPSAAQVKAGTDELGAPADAAGSVAVVAIGVQADEATGLIIATAYYAHFMQEDIEANQSNVVSSAEFTTGEIQLVAEFIDSDVSGEDLSVYNLLVRAGAEAVNRSLVIPIESRSTGARVLTDVVIGGVVAEQMASRIINTDASNHTIIEYWGAQVPSNNATKVDANDAVTVVPTFSGGTMLRCAAALYRIEDLPSLIPYAAAGVGPNGLGTLSVSLEVPERGTAIAAVYSVGGSSGWSGDLTQDVFRVIEGTQLLISASGNFAVEQSAIASIGGTTATANQMLAISLGGELPGDVSDLVATTASANSVSLAFTPAVGATSHQERHALAGTGLWTAPATLSENIVAGLDPETNYDFQVRGLNNIGPSTNWSNTDSALTTGELPLAPSSFTLTPASDTGVSDSDGVTSDTTPTFNVVFDPAMVAGDTISIYSAVGPTLLASHVLIAGDITAGNVNITPPVFIEGQYNLYTTGTNVWGEGPQSDPLIITIDASPPNIVSTDPLDDGTSAFISDQLNVYFNKEVEFGTTFTIGLFLADDTPVESWDQTDIDAALTIDDSALTINLAADLLQATSYYVQISAGAVESVAGIAFDGILDETTWNFTTESPTGVLWNPADKDPLVFLTSGGRFANNSGVQDVTQGVRSTHGISSGKYYFEMENIADGGGTSNNFFALSNLTQGIGVGTPGENANTIALRRSDRAIRYNSTTIGNLGAGAVLEGSSICFAIDKTNNLFWMRLNNTSWNNSVSANPTTGVGGLPISVTGDLYVLALVARTNSVLSLRCRELEFFYPRPPDFQPIGNLQSPDPVPLAYGELGTATWNPADKQASVALSGGDLIATNSSTESATRKVRATTGISDHAYVEIQITANGTGSINNRVGLTNATFDVTDTTALGVNANSIGIDQANGNILINGLIVGSIGVGYAEGDVIRFDIDRPGNWLYARNGAAPWNNDPTANPINKIGGIDISGVVGALFPTALVGRVGASMQMYTSDITFQYPRVDPPVIAYVDATLGSDVNDGSITFPWKTISKVNSANLYIGSIIHFKRDEVFTDTGLVCRPGCTYQDYGTGEKPEFNYQREFIGVAGDWTNIGTNRWMRTNVFQFPTGSSSQQRMCVVFDDEIGNVMKASAAAVAAPGDWFRNFSTNELTVYSPTATNPVDFWDSIKVNSSSVITGVTINNAVNVKVRNLKIVGSRDRGVQFIRAPNVFVEGVDVYFNGQSSFYDQDSNNYHLKDCTGRYSCNGTGNASIHGFHIQISDPHDGKVTNCVLEETLADCFQIQSNGTHILEDCRLWHGYVIKNPGKGENCVDIKNCDNLILRRCDLGTEDDHAITSQVKSDGLHLEDCILNSHTDNRCIAMQEGPGHYTSKRTAYYQRSTTNCIDIYGSGGKGCSHESDILVQGGAASANPFINYTGKITATQTMFIAYGSTPRAFRNNGLTVSSSITSLSHDGVDDGNGFALATMVSTFSNWGEAMSFRISGLSGGDVGWNADYETLPWTTNGNPDQWQPPWEIYFKVPIALPQNPSLTGLVVQWVPRVEPLENCLAMAPGSNSPNSGAYSIGSNHQIEKTNAAYILKTGTLAGITEWEGTMYSLSDSTQDGVGLHLASGGMWGGSNWAGFDLNGATNTQFDFLSITSLVVTTPTPLDPIATATVAGGHSYVVGDRVLIEGAVPFRLCGWKRIESVTATTFTYKVPLRTPDQTATGTITVTDFSPSATSAHASGAPVVWAPDLMSENKDFKGNAFALDSQRSWGAIQAGGDFFSFVNPEAAAYVARMEVQPDDTRKGLIDDLFTALKAGAISGTNLLTKLDVLVLYKSHHSQASLLNALSSNFDAAVIGTPTFTVDAGWSWPGQPDLSGISTNYDPVAVAGLFLQNNASFGVWENLDLQAASSRYGWFDGTDGVTVAPRTASPADGVIFRINSATTIASGALVAPTSVGLNMVNRSGANDVQYFKNGSQIMSSTGLASTAPNAAPFKIGGITAASFQPCNPWGHVIGGSLTANEHLDLYNALNTYFSAF